jgi:hypothetical protein
MRLSRSLGLLSAGLVLLAHAAPARADGDDDPAALVRRGVALRREHRNEEALALFARAVALSPYPGARAQLALAEQALGRWLEAERDLDAALAASTEWIDKNRRSLEEARAVIREHLGWLTVDVDVATAHAQLDGRPIARGVETRVVAGTGFLEVRAPGYAPDIRRLDVRADGHARATISLEPLVAGPSAPPPPPVAVTVPDDAARPVATVAPAPIPEHPQAQRPLRAQAAIPVGPIVLGAAGLAGVATGAYFGIRTINDKNERDADCVGGCKPAANAPYTDGQTSSTASEIAFGVGLALFAGGAVWWLVDRSHPPSAQKALHIEPLVGAQMTGIVLRGSL